MADGVVDQVLQHALHQGDVAANEREIGTDARLECDAALLRAKLELLHDVLNQLRHRERLDLDRRDLRVELRQLEQLFHELPQPLAMFARDLDEPPLLLRRQLAFLQ